MGLLSKAQVGVDEYLKNGESIICRSEVSKGRVEESTGTLVCTDYRVVFFEENKYTDERVIDIDVNAIEEVEYHPTNISWLAIVAIFLTIAGAVYIAFGLPVADLIPPDARVAGALILVGVGIILVGVVMGSIGSKLILKTSQSTHQFNKGDFAPFPNAIRGSSGPE